MTPSGRLLSESAANLHVELDAAALLRAEGYRAVVSRPGDSIVVRLTSADVSGRVLSPGCP